ncbi:PilW family protein [Chitinimonas lacunae]|uniref:PilW family protein n=1 Tax=Chitinimonas lacunae TaxID=1963018 RepID=A0ABV8MSP6_9NEIS
MSRKRLLGFTLIELMVAMTLAMLLLLGIGQLFTRNRQNVTLLANFSRLQENGRFGTEYMGTLLRMAGARSDIVPLMTVSFPQASISSPASLTFPAGAVIVGRDGSSNSPDTFAIRQTGSISKPVQDCDGQQVPTSGAAITLVLTFFVSNGQLMCHSSRTSTSVALSENVVDFQVLYGHDNIRDDNAGFPNRYLTATQLGSTDWRYVVGVRTCLALRSRDNNITLQSQSYLGCGSILDRGSTMTTASDKRLYKTYVSTFNLRNSGVDDAKDAAT